jgi:hypothetical protein
MHQIGLRSRCSPRASRGADLAVASPFVNLQHLGVGVDRGTHPRTAAFIEAMHARPTFAAHRQGKGLLRALAGRRFSPGWTPAA